MFTGGFYFLFFFFNFKYFFSCYFPFSFDFLLTKLTVLGFIQKVCSSGISLEGYFCGLNEETIFGGTNE